MKNLYKGLRDRIKAECPSVKFVNMWNNQVANMMDDGGNKIYSFQTPAVFIEFANDNPVDGVGNGVQVFDPLDINIHIVHDFYNDSSADAEMENNLLVFDVEDEVQSALQAYKVSGADYGSGPIGRVGQERDYDHGNIYHSIPKYRTTWTDNSQTLPIGGYEIDPSLQAEITASKLEYDVQDINVSLSSLAFGNVAVGQSSTLSFTVDGTFLKTVLVLACGKSQYKVSLDNDNFNTAQMIAPILETIEATTVYVKFTPTGLGAVSSNLNYGVVGLTGEITLTGTGV